MSAKDRGLPTPRLASNQASIQINVIRNEKDPIFFQETYSASLEQNKPVGTQVVTVKAEDADTAVGRSSMNRVSCQFCFSLKVEHHLWAHTTMQHFNTDNKHGVQPI